MFTVNDIINLKEVVYHQGSWDQHTSIAIEGSNRFVPDASTVKSYAKLLSDAILQRRNPESPIPFFNW